MFFRVQVFQGPGFSWSRFFRVRVQGPSPRSGFRVQGPGPGFRSSRCTCLPNLVIIGHIEMEISILNSILTWIPWNKLNSPPSPPYCNIFKIRNTYLEILSPRTGWQKKPEDEEHKEHRQL